MKNDSIVTNMPVDTECRYSILCISDQYFGAELLNVKEVIPLPKLTKIPNVHDSILGVFNLRGQIYTIIDIRKLLKLEVKPITNKEFVVILEHENMTFGVVVNKVMDVLVIDSGKVQIPTRDMPPQFIQFLNGFYNHKKMGVIYLLDISALMKAEEISKHRY